ncbi:MAG: MBL fold metallo-hydrolase [Saprospiraceae bacterium]
MKKVNTIMLIFSSVLILGLLISNCKKDEDEDGETCGITTPTTIATVFNITPTDIANNENGTDLQVSFSKIADESQVKEYRVFVVHSSESGDFDLEKAQSASIYLNVAKTGSDLTITFLSSSKTTSGDLITNDNPYKVFVMSVTSNSNLYTTSLSAASDEITLTSQFIEEKVKVTYIANDGIMIEYEDKKVVIDAINRTVNLGGWVAPSSAELLKVENGVAPYDNIDVIMITHNHGDHYATSAVTNYLNNNPNTKLIVPSSLESSFSSNATQIVDFSINKFERINVIENEVSIDILQIEHFDQFGNNFSGVESFAYIVTMNDKKFLHAGDIDYVDSQLDVFNLLDDEIDVVFIPTFGDLVSTTNRDAVINNVDPEHIVCLHFNTSTLSTNLSQVNSIYPGAETFTTPFETLEY